MPRKKRELIKGTFTNLRNQSDYIDTLLDAMQVEKWREVVGAAGAKADDASARDWLANSLVGKPAVTAPTPLRVVVDTLSGDDPIADSGLFMVQRLICQP
jgi:hypothetical protein